MIVRAAIAFASACALTACGGEHAATADAAGPDTVPAASLDTIPPVARPGFFAAGTPDPALISGEWPGRAGECADPPSLQLLVDGDSVSALVVIAYPDSGPREREYRIGGRERGPPRAGTVRMSVLRILYVGLAYGAVDGVVRLERLGRRVSGQFDVRLMEATTMREARYLGTFRDIPVGPWAADLCVLAAPDSAAADSSK